MALLSSSLICFVSDGEEASIVEQDLFELDARLLLGERMIFDTKATPAAIEEFGGGLAFERCVEALGLEQVRIAPRCPWQSTYVERLIGSVRRECLDHVIVLNRVHLHRMLERYFACYLGWRTHLGLDKDVPQARRVQATAEGRIVTFPEVGGLHHRYERRAA